MIEIWTADFALLPKAKTTLFAIKRVDGGNLNATDDFELEITEV